MGAVSARCAARDNVIVKAIVDGKIVRLKLSSGLARSWRQNRGKTMTAKQAIEFVERRRRQRG
jgi:hypothetical protein